jgi:hypothetical protein
VTRQELRVALDWFCGCGSPEGAARTLLDLLELHPLYEHREKFMETIPGDGLQYLVLYALDHVTQMKPKREGWFEHGGSIGGQWLTPEGEAARDALRREAIDNFEALFEPHCIHGYDAGDESHDCMAMAQEGE